MKTIFKISLLMVFTLFCQSCSNDDDNSNGSSNNRTLKYEITGTYSGDLIVVYTGVNGTPVSEVVTSLPWSKSITYPTNIISAGISAGSVTSQAGVAGETGSMKIIINNEVIRVSDKVVATNGLLNFDPLEYDF